jgi:hypothetical protein
MSERTTKEVATPGGHTVVLKEYVTAREMMPILKSASATSTPAENIDKALKMIEVAVVSVDGATENVIETVQDLPLADYMFLTKEVAALADFQGTKN